MRRISLSVKVVFGLMFLLFGAGSVNSAGLISDLYLNRMINNYRHHSGFHLSPSMTTEIDVIEGGFNFNALTKIGVNHWSLYALVPIRLRWTVGLGYYSPGMFTQYVINERGERQEATFQVGEAVYTLHGAYRFSWLAGVGMNINYNMRQDVDYVDHTNLDAGIVQVTNDLVAVDLGFTLYPFESYTMGDLELGVTAQNLTGMFFELDRTGETADPNLVFSYRYNFFRRQIFLSGDVSLNSFLNEDDGAMERGFSVDALYQFPAFAGVGLGYIHNYYSENFVYLTGELRLQHIIGNFMRATLQIGTGLDEITDLNYVYRAGLTGAFGPTREDRLAARLFNLSRIAPMTAYNEALRLYNEKRYWEASFKFGYVIAKYPTFYLVDAAAYYLGSSYEKLNMKDAAMNIYTTSRQRYVASDWQPFYMFGQQNIHYKKGNFKEALAIYVDIENQFPQSDAVHGARYVAGNIYFDQNNYRMAVEILARVDSTSRYFPYAKYTEALAHLAMNNMDAALGALAGVVNMPHGDDLAKRALQEKANVLIGHVFQEQATKTRDPERLRMAYIRYSQVPETSPFYAEALVGAVWVLIRGQQYREALRYIDMIVGMDTPYRAEGYLLMGYARTYLGEFAAAVQAFDIAIQHASARVDQTKVDAAELRMRENTNRVNQLAESALDVALSRVAQGRAERVTALGADFRGILSEREAIELELIALERTNRFQSNFQQVLRDAEFAKGVTASLQMEAERGRVIEEMQQEVGEADEELRQLEKELEELERLEQMR